MSKKLWIPAKSRDYVDADYLAKLSEEDKDFYLRFVDEYYCGNGTKEGSMHIQELGLEIKTELYKDNNTRTKDLYSHSKYGGKLMPELKEELLIDNHEEKEIDDIKLFLFMKMKELKDELSTENEKEWNELIENYSLELMRFCLRDIKVKKKEKNREYIDRYNSKKNK